jgi:2-oxoisovalerate dehydrogenase E2 component (dihydrolipoyl transacylase)
MDWALPELGEGVYEAEVVSWLVRVGDTVKRGQNLMEVLTDKATMEVPSPFAGTIAALEAEVGQQIKVGDVVLAYEPAGKAKPAREETPVPASQPSPKGPKETAARPVATGTDGHGPAVSGLTVKAAPSVRLLARQLGIDLRQVSGSGPDGRVLVEDVTRHLTPPPPRNEPKVGPAFDLGIPGSKIKLVGVRRKIAEHMVKAKRTIPHYSYVDECDVSDLVRLRESLRETAERKGGRLTYLAFFVKAVVAALKEVPIVNSSLLDEAEEIHLHDRYHIGIAVAAPQGLMVPVVHEADQKDLFEVAGEIERLSQDARAGKVRREDLIGGTFTITSIGSIGGLISTPVINHPEVAILGIGKVVKRPVYDEAGQIRPAHLVYLSFSFDHRVLDGAIGAVFGNAVKNQLQNPANLLVD